MIKVHTVMLIVFTLLVLALAGVAPVPTHDLQPDTSIAADVEYVLRTGMTDHAPMAFIGVSEGIAGITNPRLTAIAGQTIKITIVNEHGIVHDFTVPDLGVTTGQILTQNEQVTIQFAVPAAGEYKYYCSVPGHEQIGMLGLLIVTPR